MKKCPYCVEDIQDTAIKCKFCQSDLTTPEAALKSQALKTKLANDEMRRANEERLAKAREEAARNEAERIRMLSLPGIKEKIEGFGSSFTLQQLIKIESLPEEEAREYVMLIRSKSLRKTIWVMCGFSILLFWLLGFRFSGFLFILVALWLLPRPGEEIFLNRIKRIKEFKMRAIVSVPLLIFSVFDVYAIAGKAFSERPQITVLSSTGTVSGSGYALRFSAIGADNAKVNGKFVNKSQDGSFELFVSMPHPSEEIDIEASNMYYDSKLSFIVERLKTDEEIKREKDAAAAKVVEDAERAKREQAAAEAAKKAEAERLLSEQKAAAKVAAEKAAWDRTKAGKLCAKHTDWSKSDCEDIAAGKYWIGMTYDMLIALRGLPDHANPSNYGAGTSWQWCWSDRTPSCFYDRNSDAIVDSYN